MQFIGDRLLEINPRISTVIYQEDLNLPYLAVRHALGEISRDELASLRSRVRPTRRVLRYYEQVEWDEPRVGVSAAPQPGVAARLLSLGRQSLVYGLGPVVSRFASLFLLPLYTHYLQPGDYGRVETLTALVAVAVTIAQLGLVNALFRFALERQGEARAAVIRTALAATAVSGLVVATLAALATPIAAPHLLGPGEQSLWLLSCSRALDQPRVRADGRPLPRRAAPGALPRDHDRQRRGHRRALGRARDLALRQGVRPDRRQLRGHGGRARGGARSTAARCSTASSTGRCSARCSASVCRSCPRVSRSGA